MPKQLEQVSSLFNQLPTELQVQILSYLPVTDLIKNMPRVSKHFNLIVTEFFFKGPGC